jgi:hypothetical protein
LSLTRIITAEPWNAVVNAPPIPTSIVDVEIIAPNRAALDLEDPLRLRPSSNLQNKTAIAPLVHIAESIYHITFAMP